MKRKGKKRTKDLKKKLVNFRSLEWRISSHPTQYIFKAITEKKEAMSFTVDVMLLNK